jgi:hypothetical protein
MQQCTVGSPTPPHISYWSLLPTVNPEKRLTWEAFAKGVSIDPLSWDLKDPRG